MIRGRKLSFFNVNIRKNICFCSGLERAQSLMKNFQKKNSFIEKHHFKTIFSNIREAFLSRFQKLKNRRAASSFVKNLLNAKINGLTFSSFETDIISFKIQLMDLKNKEIWHTKF